MIDIPNTPRIEDISEYSGQNYISVMLLYNFRPSQIILASDLSVMVERGGFSRIEYWKPMPRVAFSGTFCAFLGKVLFVGKN